MKHNTISVLDEAKELVKRAVAKGLMSYPASQRFLANGDPDPMLIPTEITTPQRYSTSLFLKAYTLRQSGLSLNDTAAACGVPRGSVVYLISQGHEITLQEQRAAKSKEQSK